MECPAGLEITTPEECEYANTYTHWWAHRLSSAFHYAQDTPSDDVEAIEQLEIAYQANPDPLLPISTQNIGPVVYPVTEAQHSDSGAAATSQVALRPKRARGTTTQWRGAWTRGTPVEYSH